MGFLTARDRTAILLIMGVIVAGWGVRLVLDHDSGDPFTVYRDAVPVPEVLADPSMTAPEGASLFAPIDINTATAEELTILPMIGPARAEAIIAFRNEHGLFDSPDQLTEVSGIGPGILARIRPDIVTSTVVSPQTASDSTGFSEK